ncbi:MAG TPA: HepT-like ribonuclease domain-containing protein [Thermoanaerobaculia bacterium]|nr:HepT-like ribonuclease domain-containing protein [Thermoanaerobaculia bacterium]
MDTLAQRVRAAVADLPISLLVIFGSRARASARPDSDLDVAVLPSSSAPSRRRLQARLASVLADVATNDRVDVVFLDEATPLLRQRIMERGRLVVCEDPITWRALRVATMREHADREPHRRLLRESQRRWLAEGRSNGRSGRAVRSLERLDSYLRELRGFRSRSEDEYVLEPALHVLAERYLHLACEAVFDIAHHVIADEGYRQPVSYKDAIAVLREEGLVDSDLADRLTDWMGFRQVLVHLYLDIDHQRTWAAIQEDLGDLDRFASAMARFLT